jgi:hypothetical protein
VSSYPKGLVLCSINTSVILNAYRLDTKDRMTFMTCPTRTAWRYGTHPFQNKRKPHSWAPAKAHHRGLCPQTLQPFPPYHRFSSDALKRGIHTKRCVQSPSPMRAQCHTNPSPQITPTRCIKPAQTHIWPQRKHRDRKTNISLFSLSDSLIFTATPTVHHTTLIPQNLI